mmetsp:Transcript_41802/g.48255  ORF Transcript_41802/g.48255 Transcript_41802/m.48255 type:complete len:100 (-) Transcript_41802:778-1077(-)
MDLIALIGDSSDDDVCNGGYCCGTEEGENYENIEKKRVKKGASSGRNKLRRRGSIDVIQSSEVQHSDFFFEVGETSERSLGRTYQDISSYNSFVVTFLF